MAKVPFKRTLAYWRRKAHRWHQFAEAYKKDTKVQAGLRMVNEILYDTQLEWLKKHHPTVYTEMIKVFPEDSEDPELWAAFG